jgi:hypothetical protein
LTVGAGIIIVKRVACLHWPSSGGPVFLLVNKESYKETSQLLDALVVSVTGLPERLMEYTLLPMSMMMMMMSIASAFDRDVLTSVFPWKQFLR